MVITRGAPDWPIWRVKISLEASRVDLTCRIADVECLHGHAAIRMATRALRASADDRGGLHFSVVMRSRSAPIANSGAVETTADGLGGRTCKPDSGARTLSFDRAPAGLPG